MRDDERYATGTNTEQAVIMPSTCSVTWLWVSLSAAGRSPEASVGLAVGCSVVEHQARARSAGPTAAHVLLAPCEGLGAAHVRLAVRVRT